MRHMFRAIWLHLSIAAFAMTSALNASQPGDFLSVERWQGTVTVNSRASGKLTTAAGIEEWSTTVSADVKIRFDHPANEEHVFLGAIDGSVKVEHKLERTTPDGCVATITMEASGPPAPLSQEQPIFEVTRNGYRFDPVVVSLPAQQAMGTRCDYERHGVTSLFAAMDVASGV